MLEGRRSTTASFVNEVYRVIITGSRSWHCVALAERVVARLAFHLDLASSKGTKDCVQRALKAGIPTWLTNHEDGIPIRQLLPTGLEQRA